jgi:hypothetical protein
MVQELPAATLEPQVFVSVNPALAAIDEIANDVLPVLFSVTGMDALVVPMTWLPKVRVVGENVTFDVPVPLRETVCGLPATLSHTENTPLALPSKVGVNVTLILHELPAARLEPQVLVSEKPSVASMSEMVSAAVPLLVRVIV